MKLRIGTVDLENNLILAPMAGVTDLPFRLLCKEQGCGLLCMEMVSAKAIQYNNKNTKALLQIEEAEPPISLQLFGADPEIMGRIAAQIESLPFDILDINMGCPVPKVVNNHEGSALMKNPALAGRIVSSVVKAIQKPVTVKIRSGFDDSNKNAVEIAKIIEQSGAAAVAVHGRTREQYYSGEADWEIIRKVKEAVSIPVIGNGDIVDGPSAVRMLETTNCDGLMIGRAVRGNPWLFAEIQHFIETGKELGRPAWSEVKQTILKHAQLLVQHKGEYIGFREMRKHVAWYTAGYPHSSQLRRQCNELEDMDGLLQLLEEYPL